MLEATLRLAEGVDPAEAGGAVTTALCGHWEHEGGCRWPHNNEISAQEEDGRSTFRTVFVAPPAEAAEVRARIETALREGARWSVEATRARELHLDESALAARLARTPPPAE